MNITSNYPILSSSQYKCLKMLISSISNEATSYGGSEQDSPNSEREMSETWKWGTFWLNDNNIMLVKMGVKIPYIYHSNGTTLVGNWVTVLQNAWMLAGLLRTQPGQNGSVKTFIILLNLHTTSPLRYNMSWQDWTLETLYKSQPKTSYLYTDWTDVLVCFYR